MRALLALLVLASPATAAPVPRHLGAESPPADPVRRGFRWEYQGSTYEATCVVDETVFYRCVSEPARFYHTWGDDFAGINVQSRAQTRREAGLDVPGPPATYRPFTLAFGDEP